VQSETPTARGEFRVPIVIPWRLDGATEDPTSPLVLALHGQGMDQDSFARVLQRLFALPCRFLLPRAPWPFEVPSENRIGASWYPYDGDAVRFEHELARTEVMLLQLLEDVETRRELRPRRRVVLGFSQGGYCGGVIALRHTDRFHGLVVSGARVKTEILAAEMRVASARDFRVLLCHGLRDVAVLPEAAERSREALVASGIPTELHTFDTGHILGKRQVEDIGRWLAENYQFTSGLSAP